jgi:cobalt-zinc-cadmium efflux system protein
MLVTGGALWLDPTVSLLIGAIIALQAWRLVRASAEVLLESAPAGLDVDELSRAMAAVEGVESVHDLHVWSLSSEVRALSAHIVVAGHPTLEEAQLVGAAVKQRIGARFDIAHATIELECEECVDDTDDACAMPGVQVQVHAHHH